jgi:thiamine monophosphate synthase
VRHGIRLYQLREPDMAPDQRVALARRVNAIAGPAGARVLLVGSALESRRAGLAGVHSTAQELRRLRGRPPVKLWVCSCHDDSDLTRATELGADAVVVSPVLETAAHPGSALGWNGVERLSARASLPVYAQGGLDAALLARAQRAGAIGIATARWQKIQ